VLLHPRRSEIVGDAADRDHQRVVADRAHRGDQAAVLVDIGAEVHQTPGAVERDHLAEAEAEAMPVGLGEIVELVPGNVHAASGDFVEQRLPQMGARLFHQRNVGAAAPAQPIAQPGDQFEPTGPTPDDDDPMELAARGSRNRRRLYRGDRHGNRPCSGTRGIVRSNDTAVGDTAASAAVAILVRAPSRPRREIQILSVSPTLPVPRAAHNHAEPTSQAAAPRPQPPASSRIGS
jgi:hypothetical protein